MAEPAPPAVTPISARTVSVTGVAGDAIEALKGSPTLLLIVLLNMVFAVIAGYYLLQVEQYREKDRALVAGILDKCVSQMVPVEVVKDILVNRSSK